MSSRKSSLDRVQLAVNALHSGEKVKARRLIQEELRENPSNITAWTWACELTRSEEEKKLCLRKILSLDPDHSSARIYLNQLENTKGHFPASSKEGNQRVIQDKKHGINFIDLLFYPLEFLFSLSLPTALALFFASIIFAGFAYFRLNTNFFGLAELNYNQLDFSSSRENIRSKDLEWQKKKKKTEPSTFSGVVRHISPFRRDQLRILTHDILVTTEDFANPEVVKTDVVNHKFIWQAPYNPQPKGSIHLLHAVPANQEIASSLYQIKKWQEVKITGREILEIKAYNQDGDFLISWSDNGCNTILIDSVVLLEE